MATKPSTKLDEAHQEEDQVDQEKGGTQKLREQTNLDPQEQEHLPVQGQQIGPSGDEVKREQPEPPTSLEHEAIGQEQTKSTKQHKIHQ